MSSTKSFILSITMLALICQSVQCWAKPKTEAKSKPHSVASKSKGELTFSSYCSSCHVNGGNIVNSEKPLAGSKYLSSYVSFKNYLRQPVGTMPHYENLISNDKILKELFNYVQTLKKSEGS